MDTIKVDSRGKRIIFERATRTPGVYLTMADVRAANAALGHYWFEPATLRFFSSRILANTLRGGYFVTSERFDANSARFYSVRQVQTDGAIDTVGKFQAYTSAAQAKRAIAKLVEVQS